MARGSTKRKRKISVSKKIWKWLNVISFIFGLSIGVLVQVSAIRDGIVTLIYSFPENNTRTVYDINFLPPQYYVGLNQTGFLYIKNNYDKQLLTWYGFTKIPEGFGTDFIFCNQQICKNPIILPSGISDFQVSVSINNSIQKNTTKEICFYAQEDGRKANSKEVCTNITVV